MKPLKWIAASFVSIALVGCGAGAPPANKEKPKTPTGNATAPVKPEDKAGKPEDKTASSADSSKTPEKPTTPTAPTDPADPKPAKPEAAVSHPLTLVMTIKSPEDEQKLRATLTKLLTGSGTDNPVSQAMDKLAIVHDARFVFLDGKLLVITTYDHDFEAYIDSFVDEIGHIFDLLLSHMADAPPLPVKDNRDDFLKYIQANDLKSFNSFYSAYPSLSRKDVLSLAQKAGGAPEIPPISNPLTLVLTIKSPEDAATLKGVLTKLGSGGAHTSPVDKAMDKLGLVHFARFVFFDDDKKLLVITTYDNEFETYIDSFTKEIGPIFDLLLSHSKDAPKLPVHDNGEEFLEFVQKNDLKSFGTFYSGYPTLSVLKIRTLQKPAASNAEPNK